MRFGCFTFPIYAFMIADTFRHHSKERMEKFFISLMMMSVIVKSALDEVFERV
ncbi:MAG: hypothetical protein IKE51_01075 [Solobacterium sp.]|nr:hypothetical protein [Solobacterium sp.]